MALMFTRLARNFIRDGYFPTDDATLSGVLAGISCEVDHVRVIDPCCGEGVALAEITARLRSDGVEVNALGVEFDAERAWHAKTLLDVALHSDVHDVAISRGSCGLLFLNPPYGDVVADKAGLTEKGAPRRLESIFLQRCLDCLQVGGVLVYIVPNYVVKAEMASLLVRNFDQVRLYRAPEQRFKQCVIFGVRRRPRQPTAAAVEALVDAAARAREEGPELPSDWDADKRYAIPGRAELPDFRFHAMRIDARQLAGELERLHSATLWPTFEQHFRRQSRGERRPLRALSRWHLALALAAGQISGVVQSKTGRTLLIKGDTHKTKARTVETSTTEDGTVEQTVVMTDRFVPTIRGIDLTPGNSFGQLVTIS